MSLRILAVFWRVHSKKEYHGDDIQRFKIKIKFKALVHLNYCNLLFER